MPPSKKSQTWWWTVHHETLSIALSALGGIPFRPGNLPFFSLLMACLTLMNVFGLLIDIMHGFCSSMSRTLWSTGRWLFSTFSKCALNIVIDVKLSSMTTTRWSLSSLSRVVQQFLMCLCSDVEHTSRSSMWESTMPELVGQLLIQVAKLGLCFFASKKVFITRIQWAR